jgi:hypothetical protein
MAIRTVSRDASRGRRAALTMIVAAALLAPATLASRPAPVHAGKADEPVPLLFGLFISAPEGNAGTHQAASNARSPRSATN